MKVLNYLKGVKREFGLVKWPTKKATWYFTLAVLTISIFFGIYIGFFDVFFAKVLDIAINLKEGNGFIESISNVFSDKASVVNDSINSNTVDLKDIINEVEVNGADVETISSMEITDSTEVADAATSNQAVDGEVIKK